jgi:hypothetical protein
MPIWRWTPVIEMWLALRGIRQRNLVLREEVLQ